MSKTKTLEAPPQAVEPLGEEEIFEAELEWGNLAIQFGHIRADEIWKEEFGFPFEEWERRVTADEDRRP